MSPHAFASGPPSSRGRQTRSVPAAFGAALASAVAVAVPGALAGSGCSLAVDGFVSGCDSDRDCQAKGESFAGSTCRDGACRPGGPPSDGSDWSCLGQLAGEQAAPPEQVRVSFRFLDLASAGPIAGVSLSTCSGVDVTCARPLGPALLGGVDGLVAAQVSTASAIGALGFAGYFQASAPERESALYSFHPPLLKDDDEVVVLGRPGQLSQIAPSLGFEADPERGNVILLGRDCGGKPAAGMTFEFASGDPAVKLFYGVNSIPTPNTLQTDRTGTAFAMNVPVGVLSFRLGHVDRGDLAQFIVRTRRDYVSMAVVRPDH